ARQVAAAPAAGAGRGEPRQEAPGYPGGHRSRIARCGPGRRRRPLTAAVRSTRQACGTSHPQVDIREVFMESSIPTEPVARSKAVLWVGRILSALPVLLMAFSAAMKFSHSP